MKFQDFIKQTKDFQEKLLESQEQFSALQSELLKNQYEGSSSDRSVVIVLDGNGDMKSIKIDPEILEKGSDFVQDLVVKAYSDAKLKAGITSPNTAVNLMGQFMSKNFFR